jgi:hypothetical protein
MRGGGTVDSNGDILLVRQYRKAVGKDLLEIRRGELIRRRPSDGS